ncbi:hypothetical protein [Klebsiella phage 05F01]|nr:hypothetical protein [Klebsiella phage 05F01]
MAVFGELVAILIGLFIMLGGLISVYGMVMFSGASKWNLAIPIFSGSLIIWAAIHYGPIVISVGVG